MRLKESQIAKRLSIHTRPKVDNKFIKRIGYHEIVEQKQTQVVFLAAPIILKNLSVDKTFKK